MLHPCVSQDCADYTSQLAANALGGLEVALSDRSADDGVSLECCQLEYSLLMLGCYVLLCMLFCKLGVLHFPPCQSGHLFALCPLLAMFNT